MHSAILTAIIGSGASGVASVFLSIFGQHSLSRKTMLMRDMAKREQLYSEFIQESAKLYIDVLDGVTKKPSSLVPLYSLVNRMRLISSSKVLLAAKRVADEILNSQNLAPITLQELQAIARENQPNVMRDFSEACRLERESLLYRLK